MTDRDAWKIINYAGRLVGKEELIELTQFLASKVRD